MQTIPVPVVIVAGMSRKNHVIGKENGLLWHVPADMKRFKTLTLGHPVIMGRKTFESIVAILGKPLPGRTNIVITRTADYAYPADNVQAVTSLEAAFETALTEHPTEIHIGGGAEIYRQALPYVSRLYLTLFDDEPAGDAYFPEFETEFEVVTEHEPQTHEGITYQWVDYLRKRS